MTFYQWLLFLIIGIAILGMLPPNIRVWVIAIIVLGGLATIESKSKGGLFGNFAQQLTGQTTATIAPLGGASITVN